MDSDPALIHLDAVAVSILVGTVLPLAVGLLTKLRASSGVKAVLLALLTALAGLITTATLADGSAVISWELALNAGLAWVTGVATHYGLWKATGVAYHLAPSIGVGAPVKVTAVEAAGTAPVRPDAIDDAPRTAGPTPYDVDGPTGSADADDLP